MKRTIADNIPKYSLESKGQHDLPAWTAKMPQECNNSYSLGDQTNQETKNNLAITNAIMEQKTSLSQLTMHLKKNYSV